MSGRGGGKGGGVSGRSQGGKTRVKTGRGRTTSSVRWLERQLNDPYVKAAKAAGYRSRAAFKLKELDERFDLLKNATRVVDLGCAPGGWCQVVKGRKPKARVVGVDILEVEPLPGVELILGDICEEATAERIRSLLDGRADVVLSDMAANTVGHKQTDHLRTMGLIEAGLEMALEILEPGGTFVAKVLAGGADSHLLTRLKQRFKVVKHAKPPASRKDSSEWYVIAQDFRPETTG